LETAAVFPSAKTSTSCGPLPTGTVALDAPVFASRTEAVLSDLLRMMSRSAPLANPALSAAAKKEAKIFIQHLTQNRHLPGPD
jgi:hypothetical protein